MIQVLENGMTTFLTLAIGPIFGLLSLKINLIILLYSNFSFDEKA